MARRVWAGSVLSKSKEGPDNAYLFSERFKVSIVCPSMSDDWETRLAHLPVAEFAFPGPLRDRLVAAVLRGTKTATSFLAEEAARLGDPWPMAGQRELVIDSDGRGVCVTEVVSVRSCRLADVPDEHARGENEDYQNHVDWRQAHERFWSAPEYLEEIGEPPIVLDDNTEVVLVRFEVVEVL